MVYGGSGEPPNPRLPTTFFVKFSIQKISAMRLLCESTGQCATKYIRSLNLSRGPQFTYPRAHLAA